MKTEIRTKICARCGEEKPVEEFYFDRRHNNRYRSFCKACMRQSVRDRYIKLHGLRRSKRTAEKDGWRVCYTCNTEKPVEEFYIDRRDNAYRRICKACDSEYHRRRYAAMKEQGCSAAKSKAKPRTQPPAITCKKCYYKGLFRGTDDSGRIYRCRHLHIIVRDYTPAGGCEDFIENDSGYENNMVERIQ